MSCCLAILTASSLMIPGSMTGIENADFWLTTLLEMNWTEGDMFRDYMGVVSLFVEPYIENNPAFEEYIEGYSEEYPGQPVPDVIGTVHGSGELNIEGSGTSGDVSMTYEGTASVTATGAVVMDPERGQVMNLVLSGTTNEIWTVHTPDGDITMPHSGPMTPVSLSFIYGSDEIEYTEPWDEGTSRCVFNLAQLNDPYTDTSYDGPLFGY